MSSMDGHNKTDAEGLLLYRDTITSYSYGSLSNCSDHTCQNIYARGTVLPADNTVEEDLLQTFMDQISVGSDRKAVLNIAGQFTHSPTVHSKRNRNQNDVEEKLISRPYCDTEIDEHCINHLPDDEYGNMASRVSN